MLLSLYGAEPLPRCLINSQNLLLISLSGAVTL